jgi:SAM-dependent methyltransferase
MPGERLETAMAVPSVTVASFDAWAGDYDHSPLQPTLYLPVHRTTLGLARRLVPRPRRILDVGCGTARLLRRARRHYPQAELVGVDPARPMLTTARSRTSPGLRIRYVQGAAEQLPFAGEAFELVLATLSLRHWTDQDAGIGQVARVLAPGGVLVVADVFPACRDRIGVVGWLRRGRLAVPAELATVLAAHGLAVIAQDRTSWFALPDVQVIAAHKLTSQSQGSGLATLRPRAIPGSSRR